jgi:hypothetical protein
MCRWNLRHWLTGPGGQSHPLTGRLTSSVVGEVIQDQIFHTQVFARFTETGGFPMTEVGR